MSVTSRINPWRPVPQHHRRGIRQHQPRQDDEAAPLIEIDLIVIPPIA
jgi:hypothetical protein